MSQVRLGVILQRLHATLGTRTVCQNNTMSHEARLVPGIQGYLFTSVIRLHEGADLVRFRVFRRSTFSGENRAGRSRKPLRRKLWICGSSTMYRQCYSRRYGGSGISGGRRRRG